MEKTMTKQNTKNTRKVAIDKKPMTQERASAIQSDTMKKKGTVSKDDFAARAARAVARNGKTGAGR
jgi:hypothetical protein